jgi:hypothetical protein
MMLLEKYAAMFPHGCIFLKLHIEHLSHLWYLTSDIFVHFDDDLGSRPILKKTSSARAHGTYRPTLLPVVLYECETWSLTLREERRLRVFENRALRKKRDALTGERRRQRNEELHFFFHRILF